MSPLDSDIFRQVLECLPVGIYMVKLDHRILFWNKAAERITGHLAQDVIGRSCGEEVLVHCAKEGEPVCSTNSCLLSRALRDRQPAEALLFARHKDGHRISVHVRSIPLVDENGKVYAIVEMFQQQAAGPGIHLGGSGSESNDGLNIPSLSATETYLNSRLQLPGASAVFMVQIGDLAAMARQRGLEMVHASMRALVHTVGDLLPMPHFLGRWHDQSFLVVIPNASKEVYDELLAELRGLGNSLTVLWWGDRVAANVIVKGTLIHDHESLQALIRNHDPAAGGD